MRGNRAILILIIALAVITVGTLAVILTKRQTGGPVSPPVSPPEKTLIPERPGESRGKGYVLAPGAPAKLRQAYDCLKKITYENPSEGERAALLTKAGTLIDEAIAKPEAGKPPTPPRPGEMAKIPLPGKLKTYLFFYEKKYADAAKEAAAQLDLIDDKSAKQGWQTFLGVLYLCQKDCRNATTTLKEMIKRYDEVTGMEAQILSGSREAAEFMLVSFCGEPPPLHELEAREARYAELSARSKLDNMGYRMARAAIFTFLRALKSGDEASSAKALENLMRLMTDSSKGAPRRDYLESEIVFRASVAAGYAKLGDLYEKLGRKDKALEAYRKAEISPAGQWYVAEKIKKRSN